jgi:Tfp pilus assembly protein PilE
MKSSSTRRHAAFAFVVLAALAAPLACNPFGQYKCRSLQTEAKATLGAIKAGETAYYKEHGSYTASTADLGTEVAMRHYTLELSITGGGKGYKATAKGDKPDTMGDEWMVDDGTAVTAIKDKCH